MTLIRMTPETMDRAADIEAIHQLVATVEHSQQTKDAEEFLGLFHPDAIWTTAQGKVLLIGLDAISQFTRKVLPAASWDAKVTYEMVHVLFTRPDVAAVKVRQRYLTPGEEREGAPLYRPDVLQARLSAGHAVLAHRHVPAPVDQLHTRRDSPRGQRLTGRSGLRFPGPAQGLGAPVRTRLLRGDGRGQSDAELAALGVLLTSATLLRGLPLHRTARGERRQGRPGSVLVNS